MVCGVFNVLEPPQYLAIPSRLVVHSPRANVSVIMSPNLTATATALNMGVKCEHWRTENHRTLLRANARERLSFHLSRR
jgi:hypothetical protein